MTDYVLKISSFGGMVAGARHFRGRVEGPHPQSCHGGTRFNAPEARGKTICHEGHEIPKRVTWDVDAFWTEERHERWAAGHFEGDGPGQFLTEEDLIQAAISRFRWEREPLWFEEKYPRPEPGDRLYLRYLPEELSWMDLDDGYGDADDGKLLTEIKGEQCATES